MKLSRNKQNRKRNYQCTQFRRTRTPDNRNRRMHVVSVHNNRQNQMIPSCPRDLTFFTFKQKHTKPLTTNQTITLSNVYKTEKKMHQVVLHLAPIKPSNIELLMTVFFFCLRVSCLCLRRSHRCDGTATAASR